MILGSVCKAKLRPEGFGQTKLFCPFYKGNDAASKGEKKSKWNGGESKQSIPMVV